MKITSVKYGRSMEVGGPFGRRTIGRVWFGWEAEIEEVPGEGRETEFEVLNKLKALADRQEKIEHLEFEKLLREGTRGR